MENTRESKTRLLIADDHGLFAEGLRYIIENLAQDMRVVGTVADGREALNFAEREPFDIVLMDVRMPVMDGVEATRSFRLLHPDIRIIMLTTFDDDEYVRRALELGAAGYLMKSIRPNALLSSIRAVMAGQILIDESVRSRVLSGKQHLSDYEIIVRSLTRREREVLKLMLASKSNRQIGELLNISDHSVRNYVSKIYFAFDVRDRFELIQEIIPGATRTEHGT